MLNSGYQGLTRDVQSYSLFEKIDELKTKFTSTGIT
jgi:hypothetical protein